MGFPAFFMEEIIVYAIDGSGATTEENDIVEILREFISKQFPKECRGCGRRYDSLAEYLRKTIHIGTQVTYDAKVGDWQPDEPIGAVTLANCSCGSTLGINSSEVDIATMRRLINWAKKETGIRDIKISDLLEDLTRKIDKSVLQDESKRTVSARPATT